MSDQTLTNRQGHTVYDNQNQRTVGPNRIFDFMGQTPESMHMLTHLFSPRGIPTDYRHMEGWG